MTFCLKTLKFLNDVERGKQKPVPLAGAQWIIWNYSPGRLNGKPVSWQGDKSVIKSCKLWHLNVNFITPQPNYIVFNEKQAANKVTPYTSFFRENHRLFVFGVLSDLLKLY